MQALPHIITLPQPCLCAIHHPAQRSFLLSRFVAGAQRFASFLLELPRLKHPLHRTELAGHADFAIVAHHVVAFRRGEAAQHVGDALGRAAAGVANALRFENLDAALVE